MWQLKNNGRKGGECRKWHKMELDYNTCTSFSPSNCHSLSFVNMVSYVMLCVNIWALIYMNYSKAAFFIPKLFLFLWFLPKIFSFCSNLGVLFYWRYLNNIYRNTGLQSGTLFVFKTGQSMYTVTLKPTKFKSWAGNRIYVFSKMYKVCACMHNKTFEFLR